MKLLSLTTLLFATILFGCKSSIVDDPSLSIRYSVPELSMVKLTIENSYNTIILTPVDKEQNAGAYEINFDAYNLPEGVYFYTVELKGINSDYYSKTTKQLFLVK
jgi:hypothetical protein